MIIYKLEWTTPNNTSNSWLVSSGTVYNTGTILGGPMPANTYSGSSSQNRIEYYARKELAEAKKEQLNEAARLINYTALRAHITELDVIE